MGLYLDTAQEQNKQTKKNLPQKKKKPNPKKNQTNNLNHKKISKMRLTEFPSCPHCVVYHFPQCISSKQARTLNKFLAHCFCNCIDSLRIHTYLLGHHEMQMVASKIKYARKIKSLSRIFN